MISEDSGPVVAAHNLGRVYRVGGTEIHALKGIDLAVARGEFLAIVGVSGSGKSTLLHLAGGLDTPTTGEIQVGGRRLDSLTSFERSCFRREEVGFVFQSFYLVPSLSAEGNIRLALTFQGTYGRQRRQLSTEALVRVGLGKRGQHRPGQLSAGEQQRVAIARAIVHRPRLLLADEPTGNLDHDTAVGLLDLLRGIQEQNQMTIMMVTHDEELASSFCDRKIRIRDGRLAESWQRD